MSEQTSNAFDAKNFLQHLTQRPGVYQMFDSTQSLLYVGKAKNLKKRVASYFSGRGLSNKTVALVSRIADIQVTITSTEVEALLLEQNLIKNHRPPFNILLRDDKSYPYVFISDGDFPRVVYHRGAKREKGKYYGPYPNAQSVRESLNLLQQVFKMRQCEDSYFANRSRPCLQYQIKRCTAPCVGYVSQQEYQTQVNHTRWFLEGKSDELLADLGAKMQQASSELDFEQAAEFRDQIQHLKKLTEQQYIESGDSEADVIAVSLKAGSCCVHILFVRAGRIIASRSFYPKLRLDETEADILQSFIGQFYIAGGHEIPKRIHVAAPMPDAKALQTLLSQQAKKTIQITHGMRGVSEKWQKLANSTAEQNLNSRLANNASMRQRFVELQQVLQLPELPGRIECFDISHSSGEATVASCVVFDHNGPINNDYRRFNIEGITGGDDYAAMEQALTRRFKRLQKGEGKAPDILLIDGGKGQVSQAVAVMQQLQLNDIEIIGVAKGPSRKAGLEVLIRPSTGEEISLPNDSKALHLIQYVRDESHRFAVKGHTQRRDKKRQRSLLQDIPGVGAKRRKALLAYFGSVKAITEAPVRELKKAPGISEKTALDIYASFHKE